MPDMCKSKFREMYIKPHVEPPPTGPGVLYLGGEGAALRGPWCEGLRNTYSCTSRLTKSTQTQYLPERKGSISNMKIPCNT
ncbi:hypothetical protein E2C01_071747 [Portunus trituberculatus]|uniref:Uncharacterized protein n=1 Tax=Portunus trituberculatus TaxID=210409 RepID=A0A5B7I5V8_PORTR|nr:hypothetical protein [Portunus trituberculatus]